MESYLFAYFTGNSPEEEQICFALSQDGYNYRIEPSRINCDYHNFLKTGMPQFHGEYMTQYSWAEDTLALLLETN